jgi:hypothetical protein
VRGKEEVIMDGASAGSTEVAKSIELSSESTTIEKNTMREEFIFSQKRGDPVALEQRARFFLLSSTIVLTLETVLVFNRLLQRDCEEEIGNGKSGFFTTIHAKMG